MAASNLLTLIDDVATLLDDVAVMSKVAVKKTAGVLGDDLALNAEQVAGVSPERELPVVWAVAKGSLVNKAILVPAALAISFFLPWAVTPLMLGGLFLCFEGCEKLVHKLFPHDAGADAHRTELLKAVADPTVDVVALERAKIKGAIRTDFILSAEIIVITLGTLASVTFGVRIATLIAIALLMTIGVYGLVAAIVKLDDLGLELVRARGAGAAARQAIGKQILVLAPYLMKALGIAGTAAMFMVGGGILSHGLPAVHHRIEALAAAVANLPGVGGALATLTGVLLEATVGIVAGAIALGGIGLIGRLRGKAG